MIRIGIFGVGAIGGYLGAKLAGSYANSDRYEIIFIQRGKHFEAIKENGLKYITRKETCVRPDLLVSSPADAGKLDLVFVCLKSRDLSQAMQDLQPALHSESIIIPTMNGVGVQEKIASIITGSTVLSGCIYVSAEIDSPGCVKQMSGAGYFLFGSPSGTEQYWWIENLLAEAGIKVKLTKDINEEIWKKYLFVGSMALVTSYYKTGMGAVLTEYIDEWIELMNEILLIASLKNIQLSQENIDSCIKRAEKIPYETKTSMLIDIENGKQPELDVFAGYMLECAERNNLQLPVHKKFYDMIASRLTNTRFPKR